MIIVQDDDEEVDKMLEEEEKEEEPKALMEDNPQLSLPASEGTYNYQTIEKSYGKKGVMHFD